MQGFSPTQQERDVDALNKPAYQTVHIDVLLKRTTITTFLMRTVTDIAFKEHPCTPPCSFIRMTQTVTNLSVYF